MSTERERDDSEKCNALSFTAGTINSSPKRHSVTQNPYLGKNIYGEINVTVESDN